MRQSSAEFTQLLLKAGRGVGLPLGLAEDLVAPILWLQTCGLSGDLEALNVLTGLDEGRVPGVFPDLDTQPGGIATADEPISAIYLAAAGCDSLQSGWPGPDTQVQLANVDRPLVAATALALGHRKLNPELILNIETAHYVFSSSSEGEVICLERQAQEHRTDTPGAGEVWLDTSRTSINTAAGTVLVDAARERQCHLDCEAKGLTADEKTLRGLKSLANRLLVPESERSLRFGAGAGIIDSD